MGGRPPPRWSAAATRHARPHARVSSEELRDSRVTASARASDAAAAPAAPAAPAPPYWGPTWPPHTTNRGLSGSGIGQRERLSIIRNHQDTHTYSGRAHESSPLHSRRHGYALHMRARPFSFPHYARRP